MGGLCIYIPIIACITLHYVCVATMYFLCSARVACCHKGMDIHRYYLPSLLKGASQQIDGCLECAGDAKTWSGGVVWLAGRLASGIEVDCW